MIIEESGMRFGDYPENVIFHIEDSMQYKSSLKSNGIQSCEFILRRDTSLGEKKLFFVEAKKSCPNYHHRDESDELKGKYEDFISNVSRKMRHSLTLFGSILLRRFPIDGIPNDLLETDLSKHSIILVLVVKTAETEWLIPYQEIFNERLQDVRKLWNINQFIVINEQTAKKYNLIQRT